MIARQQGRGLADLAADAAAPVLGGPSLKAALDLDGDDPAAREVALATVLAALAAVETWLDGQPAEAAAARGVVTESLAAAQQVVAQDVVPDAASRPTLHRGVAAERRISLEDPAMRRDRLLRPWRVDGYKRHVLRDLDTGLVRAVGVTPANAPEASVTADLAADLAPQRVTLSELHIDRAYLSSHFVQERPPDLVIACKAWPVRNAGRFPKTAFSLDWEAGTMRCPNDVVIPFQPGGVVHFPANECAVCPLREQCTTSDHGRSVSIHPDERPLTELRERKTTASGRAKLRERVAVEHSLAHVGQWQRDHARYRGVRKNLFDLRRAAVVHNLHALAHYPDQRAA